MKKFCLILALLLVHTPVFGANNLSLEAENLVQLICNISQYSRVTGTISSIDISEKYRVISLNFGKNFNTSLSAVIYNDVIPSFILAGIEDPAEYFKNKTVLLEGIIRVSNGKPEIIIDSPSQIKIIDKNEHSK
ncbi:MAG: hypothetical protein A2287_01290 [Candidatus Melainabacteria bacterium RIFOXYA12_FULL_32_12]|nr:MAG: hypothetical protein A2255_08990 [Candidatus Melainabacteria bacterium RIFOXYA2_FULL_32_9]OGI30138.1 MAG: hypothetical protein A2287_01290 [Candidatus Melainabacteria bacterium RIFOXYA12_FULL_32_12]